MLVGGEKLKKNMCGTWPSEFRRDKLNKLNPTLMPRPA